MLCSVAAVCRVIPGLALMVIAAVGLAVPNLQFRRRVRRFRCRLVSRETAIHYEGGDASISMIESLSPPEFAGRRVRATHGAQGRGLMYGLRGIRTAREPSEVGREYDCSVDPHRAEQVALTPRLSG